MQEGHAAHMSKPDQAKPVTSSVTFCVLVSIVSVALDELHHIHLMNLIHHWVEKISLLCTVMLTLLVTGCAQLCKYTDAWGVVSGAEGAAPGGEAGHC